MRKRLIQEDLGSEWERLVTNVLLNRTRGDTVRRVLRELLSGWPSPEAMAAADPSEVAVVLRPCGFQNRKAATLVRMSSEYLFGSWGRPEDLSGIGRYGGDSWRIFDGPEEKRRKVRPLDRALIGYQEDSIRKG